MKKLITKLFAGVIIAATVLAPAAGTSATEQAAQSGWVYNSVQKAYNYYGTDGKKYTGWHYMTRKEGEKKDHWNYFGSDGRLYTGWQWMDAGEGEKTPHWSYFGGNGWLRTGWVQLGQGTSEPDGNSAKHWSYFGVNGWLRTGLQNMGQGTSNPDGNAAAHKSYFGDKGWLVTNKTFTYSGVSYKADDRGWLSEVNKAAGRNNTSKPAEAVKYTVTFTDGNGKTLSTQSVVKGGSAAYPENPVKEGYKFLGWDKSFYNVTSNITVNAKWEKIPSLDEIRQGILEAVNRERKAAGKKALKLNSFMNETAQEKAEDMYKLGKLNHYSANLGYIYNQFSEHGIRSVDYGENIALTYSYDTEGVMRVWMNSDGHRESILESEYTDLGVGYKDGYWVQQFAVNPEKTEPAQKEETVYIECPHCHESANKKYITQTWKLEPDGYSIGNLRICSNCRGKFYICPECGMEALSITGTDAKSGVDKYKCNHCGYVPVSTYIEKCNYCGKGIRDHAVRDEFAVHFQYSSAEKDFQEISSELYYCPESQRYIYNSEYLNNMYKKYYNEMKKYYKTDSEILKNISWYKLIREGGSTRRQEVSTPQVRSLTELMDASRLK